MVNTNRFYGYKHWTLEDPPRCFYVGKGAKRRAHYSGKKRSHKWKHIARRLGLRVEECVGPLSNQRACIWEMQYIPLMGTRSFNHAHDNDADIGCNFTDGGEGAQGYKHTKEARIEMSKRKKDRKQTPEHIAKRAASLIGNTNSLGFKHTNEMRAKLANICNGSITPDETRIKQSIAAKKWHQLPEASAKMSEGQRRRRARERALKDI